MNAGFMPYHVLKQKSEPEYDSPIYFVNILKTINRQIDGQETVMDR